MKTAQIVMLGLMFLIVFGTALKAMMLLRPDPLKRRIDGIGSTHAEVVPDTGGETDNKWLEKVVQLSSHVAKLSLPKEDWDRSALRIRFMNAGFRNASAPALYFSAKTLLALALPAAVLILMAGHLPEQRIYLLGILLVACSIGFYLPNLILTRITERRQRTLFEDLPDALDLMTVCVEAGLGVDAAMLRVTEELGVKSRILKQEFELVLLELRAGSGREKALRNLALRTGVEDIETLASMLIQADRFGTSVGDSLRVYTDNLRTKRRLRAEEQAAKIAVKLLFPLMFFIFPTLLMVLIGPAAIQITRQLFPLMSRIATGN